MKVIIKRLLSCSMAVVLSIIVLGRATDIMQRKSSDYKYIPFFEHAQDYDVLFMGTSHVMNAIFPMELWNDYGIVTGKYFSINGKYYTVYIKRREGVQVESSPVESEVKSNESERIESR